MDKILRGLRSYQLGNDSNGLYLQGNFGRKWETEQLQAECGRSETTSVYPVNITELQKEAHEHLRKHKCTCGIYAIEKNIQENYPAIVYATVVGWGQVIKATKGWRAEFARIEALWLNTACRNYHNANIHSSSDGEWYVASSGAFYCETHLKESILTYARSHRKIAGRHVSEVMRELNNRYHNIHIFLGDPPQDVK